MALHSFTEKPFLSVVEDWMKRIVVTCLRMVFRSRPPGNFLLEKVSKILVIRQHDQLGDMLCAVPLLRALRTRFPESHITLVASPVNYDVMRHHPYVNEVLNYDKQLFFASPTKVIAFYRALRNDRYDLAIVPATVSVSLTSNLLAFFSRASIRVGPERVQHILNSTSFLFNVPTILQWDSDGHRHQTLRNLDVLGPLGFTTDDLQLVIGVSEEERSEAARFLSSLRQEHKVLIGFHPGAGKIDNRWPAERFAEVVNQLHEQLNAAAVITAGPTDDEPVNLVLRHIRCPHLLVRRKPIRTVAAIVSHLNLFITNDTGIMHVAAATGVPTLSLFGPTDPLQWAPVGGKNRYIKAKDDNTHSIPAEEVLGMAKEILSFV